MYKNLQSVWSRWGSGYGQFKEPNWWIFTGKVRWFGVRMGIKMTQCVDVIWRR